MWEAIIKSELLLCQFSVDSLQFVDSVPADEQAGEEGVTVDAVVGQGERDHQEEDGEEDQEPHLVILINKPTGLVPSCAYHVGSSVVEPLVSQVITDTLTTLPTRLASQGSS